MTAGGVGVSEVAQAIGAIAKVLPAGFATRRPEEPCVNSTSTVLCEPGRATAPATRQSISRRTARWPHPDPELVERARRRRFTAEYKLRILREADGCKRPGEIVRCCSMTSKPTAAVLDAAYAATPERFVHHPPRPPALPTVASINKRAADEAAAH